MGAVSTAFPCLQGQAETDSVGDHDFPVLDLHVHLSKDLSIEEAVALSKQRGVTFGIVEHPQRLIPRDGFSDYINLLDPYPVYKGIQPEKPGWKGRVPAEFTDQLDYVLMDAMILPTGGKLPLLLWLPSVKVDDKESFMDRLVDFTEAVILEESIDILGCATFIPPCLWDEYNILWTEQRMQRIIDAVLKQDVAIEINSQHEFPKANFIHMAKAAGARFSFGTNARDDRAGNLEYSMAMAKECGLDKKDLFVPKARLES
jgi:hypothetical protein